MSLPLISIQKGWKNFVRGKIKQESAQLKNSRVLNLLLTDQPEDLRQASIHIIAVPTPINEAKQPDLTPLLNATATVGEILKAGDLVIYESTVYPGCTEENCAPLLEKISGLKYLAENKSAKTNEKISQDQSPFSLLVILLNALIPEIKNTLFLPSKKWSRVQPLRH